MTENVSLGGGLTLDIDFAAFGIALSKDGLTVSYRVDYPPFSPRQATAGHNFTISEITFRSYDVAVRRTTSRRSDDITLRSGLSVMPGQQFINTINFMVSNPGDGVGQPSLRVNTVEFCRFDQGISDGS